MIKIKWQPLLETPWNSLWRCVWNLSEWSGIGLGRYAPWVFNQALGMYRHKRIQGDD